jgi:CBS domain-containing protein
MLRKIKDVMQDREVAELPPTSTVQKAARLMLQTKQCATLVVSRGQLKGIVTEQDIVRRVVAVGLDPATTILSEVMTNGPDTIGTDELVIKGLRMMEDGGYRHLPVVRGGRILGIVSRSDFPGDEKAELEVERHYWEAVG